MDRAVDKRRSLPRVAWAGAGTQAVKRCAPLAALLLVLGMYAAAERYGSKELLFPELSALVLGAWVMKTMPWPTRPLNLWLSPTLAAAIVIMRSLGHSTLVMIGAAFVLVALQLKLFRSGVLPSLSAAILPIVTHTDKWCYPLAVCASTAAVALGRFLLEASAPGSSASSPCAPPDKASGRSSGQELLHWSKLLVGVVAVAAVALTSRLSFMIAPPLIVTFVELSNPRGALMRKAWRILALLVLAALSGVLWLYLVNQVLHGSILISVGLSLASVFLFFRFAGLSFPPAMAIGLLPTLLPAQQWWSYPVHVGLGSGAFLLVSRLCFKGSAGSSSPAQNSAGPSPSL